jgi:hypothetical protein
MRGSQLVGLGSLQEESRPRTGRVIEGVLIGQDTTFLMASAPFWGVSATGLVRD